MTGKNWSKQEKNIKVKMEGKVKVEERIKYLSWSKIVCIFYSILTVIRGNRKKIFPLFF